MFKIIVRVLFAMKVTQASLMFVLILWMVWSLSGSPGSANVFEVKDVPVDVTADNAAKARGEALRSGQQTAFLQLLKRLILVEDLHILPELTTLDVNEFVSDFAVSNEKASSVRYLANLNVRFKPEPVRRLLRKLGISFAETVSKPVLILPILQDGENLKLWERSNEWRKIWAQREKETGLVKIILPFANDSDAATLGVEHALTGNVSLLSRLAAHYDAGDTIVSYVRFGVTSKADEQYLEISNVRYSLLQEPITDLFTLAIKPDESRASAMGRGVETVINRLEEDWKIENLLSHNGRGIGTLTVPISNLQDWLDVKKRIEGVSVVRRMELVLLSIDQVRINLHYVGDHDQLRTAMRQADLKMVQEDKEWVLYTVGVGSPERL